MVNLCSHDSYLKDLESNRLNTAKFWTKMLGDPAMDEDRHAAFSEIVERLLREKPARETLFERFLAMMGNPRIIRQRVEREFILKFAAIGSLNGVLRCAEEIGLDKEEIIGAYALIYPSERPVY